MANVPYPSAEGSNCPAVTAVPEYVPPAGEPPVNVTIGALIQTSLNAAKVTVGAVNGAAVIEAAELVHPFTVCVTVYVPAEVTVITGVVSFVDQSKEDPVAVKSDVPHLSRTETTGAAGIAFTTTDNNDGKDVPQASVCVTSISSVVVPKSTTTILVP